MIDQKQTLCRTDTVNGCPAGLFVSNFLFEKEEQTPAEVTLDSQEKVMKKIPKKIKKGLDKRKKL